MGASQQSSREAPDPPDAEIIVLLSHIVKFYCLSKAFFFVDTDAGFVIDFAHLIIAPDILDLARCRFFVF